MARASSPWSWSRSWQQTFASATSLRWCHTPVSSGLRSGCVAGQTLKDEVSGGRSFLEGTHGFETVDGRTIPDDQQLAFGPARLEPLHESDAVKAVERVRAHAAKKFPFHGHRRHHREVIVTARSVEDGRVTTRGVGTSAARQQIKTTFVDEHYAPTVCARLFLSSGHRSARQASMALSSRWLARSMGCCGVQSKVLSRRETWEAL